MKRLAFLYSTFFGFGFVPLAPGTAASLAAAMLYKFFIFRLPWTVQMFLILAVVLSGALAATSYARELDDKDPPRIVIDETAGQWATLFLAPAGWLPVLLGFFLFRLFDVIKPFPIRRLERLPAGWGIMADDLGASLYAWLGLRALLLAQRTLF